MDKKMKALRVYAPYEDVYKRQVLRPYIQNPPI